MVKYKWWSIHELHYPLHYRRMGATNHCFGYTIISTKPHWWKYIWCNQRNTCHEILNNKNQARLTTNNGSNILCAVKTIFEWTHLPCFSHSLHLAIGHSLKDDIQIDRDSTRLSVLLVQLQNTCLAQLVTYLLRKI